MLGYYAVVRFAALVTCYFVVNAYTGNRGLEAKTNLDQRTAGSVASRCSNPKASIPTCGTSAPASVSTTPTRAI